jgi:hypothetical protein
MGYMSSSSFLIFDEDLLSHSLGCLQSTSFTDCRYFCLVEMQPKKSLLLFACL